MLPSSYFSRLSGDLLAFSLVFLCALLGSAVHLGLGDVLVTRHLTLAGKRR